MRSISSFHKCVCAVYKSAQFGELLILRFWQCRHTAPFWQVWKPDIAVRKQAVKIDHVLFCCGRISTRLGSELVKNVSVRFYNILYALASYVNWFSVCSTLLMTRVKMRHVKDLQVTTTTSCCPVRWPIHRHSAGIWRLSQGCSV